MTRLSVMGLAILRRSVRRVAGDSRVLTATALADFAQELGYGRPVVTGRSLDAGTIPGLDASTIQGLTPEELGGDVEGPIGPPGPAGPPGQDATVDPSAFMPDVILTDSGAAVPMPDESTQCITEPYTPDIDRIAVAQIGLSGRNDAAGSITLFARFLISEDDGMTWEQVSARISPENQITDTAQGAISYTDVATLDGRDDVSLRRPGVRWSRLGPLQHRHHRQRRVGRPDHLRQLHIPLRRGRRERRLRLPSTGHADWIDLLLGDDRHRAMRPCSVHRCPSQQLADE